MNKLFVYYSLNGNGDYVADLMKELGFDILKLETQEKWPKAFVLQILKGGFLATTNAKSKLKNDNLDNINDYDKIVIGTPVWNKRLSSPINTLIDYINKPFDLICSAGSGKAQNVEKQLMNKELKDMIILTEPLKNKEECKNIINEHYKNI